MTNQLELFPASEARRRYGTEDFIEVMKTVTEAITDACRTSREVVVNVKRTHEVYKVGKNLGDLGYECIILRDDENNSMELTIRW